MYAFLPFAIESLVCVLLAFTIGYCWLLNRRLERLRSSESMMKEIIAELGSSTAAAERAVGNLRAAIVDCNATLNERLEQAESLSMDMSDQLRMGDDILKRIGKIAVAVRGVVHHDERKETVAGENRASATSSAAESLVRRIKARQTEAAA